MNTKLYIPEVPPGQAYDEAQPFGERSADRRPKIDPVDRIWQRQAVQAHLNILFRPRFFEVWAKLFEQEAAEAATHPSLWSGVSDDRLHLCSGWSRHSENRFLIVLSGCCGLGLVAYEDNWRF